MRTVLYNKDTVTYCVASASADKPETFVLDMVEYTSAERAQERADWVTATYSVPAAVMTRTVPAWTFLAEPFHVGQRVAYKPKRAPLADLTLGTVTAAPAVDPEGDAHPNLVEVEWDDGSTENESVDDLSPAPRGGK